MTIADRDSAWAAAHDPATPAADLAAIGAAHPEFAGAIAQHPNAYPALLAWARGATASTSGSPQLQGQAPAPAVSTPSAPTRSGRGWTITLLLFLGLTLLISILGAVAPNWVWGMLGSGGDAVYAFASQLPIILVLIAAILLAPTPGRKAGGAVLAGVAAIMGFVFVLVATSYGTDALNWVHLVIDLAGTAALFCAWAVARPLRGLAYLMIPVSLILEFVITFLFDTFVSQQIFLLTRTGLPLLEAVVTSLAYLIEVIIVIALALALSRVSVRRTAASPVMSRATPAFTGAPVGSTNTLAILSLVFAFVFTPLAVVFGHVSLSQLRRTGEQGRGLAIAGLVLGYIGVAIIVIWIIYLIVVGAMIGSYAGYHGD